MHSLTLQHQLDNGATPTGLMVIIMDRNEMAQLIMQDVVMTQGEHPMVIWVADDVEHDSEMIVARIQRAVEANGTVFEHFDLTGASDGPLPD